MKKKKRFKVKLIKRDPFKPAESTETVNIDVEAIVRRYKDRHKSPITQEIIERLKKDR